jgi:glycosyltransferase involved in cell wall biosynthesis
MNDHADVNGSRFLLIGAFAGSLVNFRGPLLASLVRSGCDVHAAAHGVGDDPELNHQLAALNVKGHSIPIARAGLNPLKDIGTCFAIWRLLRQLRPAYILAYTIKPVVWGLFAASLARVPCRCAMITGLGYSFTGDVRGKRRLVQSVARLLYKFALKRAHLIFFQNRDDVALFRELGLLPDDRPVSIVNGSGVDLAHFSQQPLPEGPPSFLMIARLLGDKGVREYAAAAAIVRQEFPQAQFHLVGGTDPNPDAIHPSELEAWQADGTIIWHGSRTDVRPYLRTCHVYVLPSYREGLPRTVLEAMATGRAIITTDAPGCRETVDEGENGFLVPPRSASALARAMRALVVDPTKIRTMAERSLDIVRERYDADRVAAVLLNAMGIALSND